MICHIVQCCTLQFLLPLYNRTRRFIWRAGGDFMDLLSISCVTH
jgi:hypothetical protein